MMKMLGIQEGREKEKWLRNLAELFMEFDLRLGDLLLIHAPSKNTVSLGLKQKIYPKWLTVALGKKLLNLFYKNKDTFLPEILKVAGIDDPEEFEEYMREQSYDKRSEY